MTLALVEVVKNISIAAVSSVKKGSEILDYEIKKEIESLEKRKKDLGDSL